MTITLLHGDCRTVLSTIAPGSVQTVITSPPYWGLRDYGVDGQIGLEETIADYVTALVEVFDLVWDVLRDDGTLWLNLGDAYANDTKWGGATSGKHVRALHGDTGIGRRRHQTGLRSKNLIGLPWRVAFALQDAGWILRSEIIWHKPNVMPESVTDRPTRAHEHLFLLTKSESYYYDQDAIREPHATAATDKRLRLSVAEYEAAKVGRYVQPGGNELEKGRMVEKKAGYQPMGHPSGRNRRTVWSIPSQPYAGSHFATFPEALVEPCILAGSSAQVCPACGAAWARCYEATGHINTREPAHVPGNTATKTDSTGWAPTKRATDQRQPMCACADNDGSAASTVLDPFAGTFTVGRVALRFGRSAIGIELNPSYAVLADDRTDGVQTELFV